MTVGGQTWTYTYNADGLRTSKSNGAATYQYIYDGSKLTQMVCGSNTLHFSYDAAGTPLTVTYNGTVFYYITNVQGDVVGIMNSAGQQVVSYTYDAWGNLLSIGGSLADTLGTLNPLRYRGYVYDTETQLYYLQSRYYDPQIGRFLNADTYVATGQGLLGNNMFAYCINNPVNCTDSLGTFTISAIAIIAVGAVVGGGLGAFTALTTEGNVVESAIEGCITGAIGSGCGLFIPSSAAAVTIAAGGAFVVDVATQATSQYVESGEVSNIDLGRAAKTGVLVGLGAAIPQFGTGAADAVDAFGTALIWAEGSTLITCADIVLSKLPHKTNLGDIIQECYQFAEAGYRAARRISVGSYIANLD